MEKKEIFVIKGYIDTDTEYTLDRLKEIAEEQLSSFPTMYPQNPSIPLIYTYKFRAYTDYEEYGTNVYAQFDILYYRLETDEEYNKRVELENLNKTKQQLASEKRLIARQKKAKEKEALLADPEYQKFLELKQKFSK
jgi:hypothetical protein